MWLLYVSFLQLLVKGRRCHPAHNMCIFMTETEAQGLSAHCTKKLEIMFSLPSLSLFSTFISRMALTFAGIIFLCIWIFLALYA